MATAADDVPEAAHDPQTTDVLGWIGTILWWILWPLGITIYYILYYITFAVTFVVKLVYRPLEFILLPVLYLGQFIWACALAPFRFVAKFETIYIYLGTAALVGAALGLLISYIYGSLHGLLGLDPAREGGPSGRTAKEYREEKRKKKAKAEAPLMSPGYLSPSYVSMSDGMRKGNRDKDLISQTIMEEMDSDY